LLIYEQNGYQQNYDTKYFSVGGRNRKKYGGRGSNIKAKNN
jgi:hypothetical protein